jgi:hypothetical protein
LRRQVASFADLNLELCEALDKLAWYKDQGTPPPRELVEAIEADLSLVAENVDRIATFRTALRERIEGLKERVKIHRHALQTCENVLREADDFLVSAMRTAQIGDAEGFDYRLRKQANPYKVVSVDQEELPSKFMRKKIVYDIDKQAILDHYKETGQEPPGVVIGRGDHIRTEPF